MKENVSGCFFSEHSVVSEAEVLFVVLCRLLQPDGSESDSLADYCSTPAQPEKANVQQKVVLVSLSVSLWLDYCDYCHSLAFVEEYGRRSGLVSDSSR